MDLASDRVTAALNAVSITPKRRERFAFTRDQLSAVLAETLDFFLALRSEEGVDEADARATAIVYVVEVLEEEAEMVGAGEMEAEMQLIPSPGAEGNDNRADRRADLLTTKGKRNENTKRS